MKSLDKKFNINNIKPIKNLGQNFLIDKNITKKIANLISLNEKNIIEIGPGTGALTSELLKTNSNLVAIEIDKRLTVLLKDKFENFKKIKIIQEDFLETDLPKLVSNYFNQSNNIVVFSNLPYYLTTPIILKLLENRELFSTFVLMMQKDVLQRLNAKINTKKYNNLSIMVQHYCNIKVAFDVNPQAFFPKPNVLSSVVTFQIKPELIEIKNEIEFWAFVRNCFAKKRKTLINNLVDVIKNKTLAIEIVTEMNWDTRIRAENLTFTMFYELYRKVKVIK